MAETKGIKHFEVECQHRGEGRVVFLRLSMIRGARGKKKLLGECYTRTRSQPSMYFKISQTQTEDEAFQRFLELLIHRGFLPIKVRPVLDGITSGDWKPVDLKGIEGAETVREYERSL